MKLPLTEMTGPWWVTTRRRCRLAGVARVTGPVLYSALWSVNVIRSILPTVTGLSTGWLVSRLISSPHDRQTLVALVISSCSLILVAQIADVFGPVLSFSAAKRVDAWHREGVAELMGRPVGIEHLEDPAVQDLLASVVIKGLPGWASYSFGTAAVGQIVITTRLAGALFAAVVLATFSWPLSLGLLAVTLLARSITRREWLGQHAVVRRLAPVTRHANYWADMAVMPWAAKELRVFGLADWVIGRFRALMNSRTGELARIRLKVLRAMGRISLLLLAGVAVSLGVLAQAAASGRIPPGTLAVYLGALWGVVAAHGMDVESFDVEFAGLPTLAALAELRQRAGAAGQPAPLTTDPPALPRTTDPPALPPRVRFQGVTFRYPRSEGDILSGLDLTVAPGELLAVVGVNGAGKTTLTRLLTGMYPPTAGQIMVDDEPLGPATMMSWRRRVAVVSQDFLRYELSLRENVVLGAARHEPDPALLDRVAHDAGIDDLVARSPHGWDTPLARTYAGGIDLSGGQWQRVALARGLYAVARGARLLVLDEPTAHLDIRTELDTFSRVADRSRGTSVVLISHRLSTVRLADRIVLLDGGKIVESGDHRSLLALDGTYAEMFAAQADRFHDRESWQEKIR